MVILGRATEKRILSGNEMCSKSTAAYFHLVLYRFLEFIIISLLTRLERGWHVVDTTVKSGKRLWSYETWNMQLTNLLYLSWPQYVPDQSRVILTTQT